MSENFLNEKYKEFVEIWVSMILRQVETRANPNMHSYIFEMETFNSDGGLDIVTQHSNSVWGIRIDSVWGIGIDLVITSDDLEAFNKDKKYKKEIVPGSHYPYERDLVARAKALEAYLDSRRDEFMLDLRKRLEREGFEVTVGKTAIVSGGYGNGIRAYNLQVELRW